MSERDEVLQSLAEEIAGRFADTYREDEGLDWSAEDAEDARYVKGRLAALLASRGDLVRAEIVALSDQLHRALAEGAGLREALAALLSAYGHPDDALTKHCRSALATPSPLSDATQEVLEAAVEVRNHASKEPPVKTSLAGAMIALHDAVDRYLALLEGRDRKEG